MRYKRNFERVLRGVEISRVVCDVCKESVTAKDYYDRTEVEIQAAIGSVYPENDHRDRKWLDCCARCFVERVVPALESALGVKFHEAPITDDPYADAEWEPQPEAGRK